MDTRSSTHPPGACDFIKPDGQRCRAYSVKGKSRCIGHADDTTRKAAALKMSRSKKKHSSATTVSEILEGNVWDVGTLSYLIKLIMKDVYSGNVVPGIAHAMTALGNIALRAIEKNDLELRLEALENQVRKGAG